MTNKKFTQEVPSTAVDIHDYIVENVKDWEDGDAVFYTDVFEPRPRWDYDDYN